ncbi:XRE family transcriptional regulator [Aliamphritea hakodatensis]|uniref:XRE family transcriptional regulator n=1 Tax=Aliamphritea hakodatensis TaxID=2895352 RepID=UPI0022FD5C38|nr:XRE family transcriptional regulator [Aliamphritea hakodatensis]
MNENVSLLANTMQPQLTNFVSKITSMSIGKNVRALRKERKWTQEELARRINISRGRIAQIEKDPNSDVKAETLLSLAKAFGCLPADLSQGWGKSAPIQPVEPFVDIPVLSVELSAGFGTSSDQEAVIETIQVPESLLDEFNVNSLSARIVSVKGDSMETTLRDGDRIIVDTSQSRLTSNSIYAFAFDGELKVKRFIKNFDQNWTIRSDNNFDPAYQDQTVAPHNIGQLTIIGRVAGILARKL